MAFFFLHACNVIVPIVVGLSLCGGGFACPSLEENHLASPKQQHQEHGRSVVQVNNDGSTNFTRCGTPEPNLSREQETMIRDGIAAFATTNKALQVITIDVSFQIITNGTAGNIPQQFVTDQIKVLNETFAPYSFQFNLRETVRTNNAQLHTSCANRNEQFKAQRRNPSDGSNVLYFYTCAALGDELLGYATLPFGYAASPLLDGVVCLDQTLPGGSAAPYNLGNTGTHEVGHWLGLSHTFQGGCSSVGDSVNDTPAQKDPTFGCPTNAPDTCPAPGLDPINNFMDYSDDRCMTEFTDGQRLRMQAMWDMYRAKPPPSPSSCNFFKFILALILKILTLGFINLCG